jgi:enoyl-CoA hydratase/carnithine racemase
MEGELVWSVRGSVGHAILNRPDFHNAISKQMWHDLPTALQSMKDAGAKVIVFSGSGESFASGADLCELERLDSYAGAREHWFAIRDCLEALWSFELPTIASINGPCLGGGCLLALACDLRYASQAASFGIPTARLGIVLDDGNVARLIAAVGPAHARELLYTGATINSARAAAIGLVNEVVEHARLEEIVSKVAEQIAGNAAISMLNAKLSVNRNQLAVQAQGNPDDEVVIGSYLGSEFRRRIRQRSGN